MIMQFSCCECKKKIDIPLSEDEYKDEDLFSSDGRMIELALPYLHENKWDFILGRCYCEEHVEVGEVVLKVYNEKDKKQAA